MSSKNLIDLRGRNTRYRAERSSGFHPQPERHSSLRTRRARARALALALVALGLAILAYELHALSYSPRFNILRIEVRGVQHISPETIEESARVALQDAARGFISGATIFNYPQQEVVAAVQRAAPRAASIGLSRPSLFANELLIDVREREPFARWCATSDAPCYQMDDTGFVFGGEDGFVPYATRFTFVAGLEASSTPVGGVVSPGHLRGIAALAELLTRSDYPASRIVFGSESDFSVETEKGLLLKFTYGSHPDTLVRNLDLVFSSEALKGKEDEVEYVDLRFGNRVYYKLKGQEERQSAPDEKSGRP